MAKPPALGKSTSFSDGADKRFVAASNSVKSNVAKMGMKLPLPQSLLLLLLLPLPTVAGNYCCCLLLPTLGESLPPRKVNFNSRLMHRFCFALLTSPPSLPLLLLRHLLTPKKRQSGEKKGINYFRSKQKMPETEAETEQGLSSGLRLRRRLWLRL